MAAGEAAGSLATGLFTPPAKSPPPVRSSLSSLSLALIGVLLAASCLYVVFDARGARGVSCSVQSALRQQQRQHQHLPTGSTDHVVVQRASNQSSSTTGSDITSGAHSGATTVATDRRAPFVCPPPIPCAKNTGERADVNAQRLKDGTWVSRDVPLANRSMVIDGHPGVCTEQQTRRAFLESGVELRALMDFEPCKLFNLIQGRTLWIVGDSQGHSLLRALQAFMSTFAQTPRDVRSFAPIGIPSLDYILTFAVTTEPMCINMVGGSTRICYVRLTRADKQLHYTLEILARAIPQFQHHILAFNVGLHYRNTPWQLGRDLTDLAAFRARMREAMGPDDYLPKMIWIDTPPQHFSLPRGEYLHTKNTTADPCSPYDAARLERNDRGMFNSISDAFVANISDAHAQTWDLAKRSYFAHARVGDCTHYCRPGVPELWVYALTEALAKTLKTCEAAPAGL